jgi:hypothetical protein
MATKPKAVPKKASQGSAEQVATPGNFVLKRNHGMVINGRASAFYEAGREFHPVDDAELIARLSSSGAELEQVAAEEPQEDGSGTGEGAEE